MANLPQKLSAGQRKEVEQLLVERTGTLTKGQGVQARRIFWKQVAGGGTLLSVIFGVGLWQILKEVQSFTKDQFALPQVQLTLQTVARTEATNLMQTQIQPYVDRFRRTVEDKLAEVDRLSTNNKFLLAQSDKLNGAIQASQAETKVLLAAWQDLKRKMDTQEEELSRQAAFSRSVETALRQQKAEADILLLDVKDRLERAKTNITDLQKTMDFANLLLRVQSDERAAFDQLQGIKTPEARAALQSILRQRYAQNELDSAVHWREGIKPQELNLLQIKQAYNAAPNAPGKVGLIHFAWRNSTLTLYEKMSFLMDILDKDENLTAVEYAGRELEKFTEIPPLELQAIRKWWAQNEARIRSESMRAGTNKPPSAPSSGPSH